MVLDLGPPSNNNSFCFGFFSLYNVTWHFKWSLGGVSALIWVGILTGHLHEQALRNIKYQRNVAIITLRTIMTFVHLVES